MVKKLLFGFLVKSSAKFSKKRTKIVSVFTKMKEDLLKVIDEEKVYVENLVLQRDQIDAEIEASKNSIEESKGVLSNIENLLNPS